MNWGIQMFWFSSHCEVSFWASRLWIWFVRNSVIENFFDRSLAILVEGQKITELDNNHGNLGVAGRDQEHWGQAFW
jgi:hypothetical protein